MNLKFMRFAAVLLIALCLSIFSGYAEIKLPTLVSDGMHRPAKRLMSPLTVNRVTLLPVPMVSGC
jgi:hypothetical protein